MKNQLIFLIILLVISTNIFGWGGITHKKITEFSWQKSKKLGNVMFLLSLNLNKGMWNERLSDGNEEKNPDEWLQFGAEHEDDTDDPSGTLPDRSNNHFHNPLKEWGEAGLSDIATGSSSIFWAQDGSLQQKISNKQGDRSWQKAREYYYKALIEVQYPSWRKNYFAEMFKILGHQVHLLQDMAVPDHVRNDTHVLNSLLFGYWKKKNNSFRCIEGWAAADFNINKIKTLVSGVTPTPIIDFSMPPDPVAIVPSALLSDTKQYKVSQIPLAGLNQGLAEYTNANFFSEDTIFTEEYEHNHKHWFPHPNKSETSLLSLGMPSMVYAEDGRKDWIKPVKKISSEIVENLLTAGYYEERFDKETYLYKFTFYLSDVCHEEYASKLIPRAVGYSAALLDYFFRGEIEVTLPENDGIYSFCFVPAEGFKKISVMAKNITRDNEEMTSGFISLIVSYRKCEGSPFVPNPPMPETERSFIKIDYPSAVDIPRDAPIRLDFDLSGSPLPVNAVDVNLTLVFQGFLGGEFANAVAIGFKDISEPTPIDLYNNTDKVCFNNNYVNYDDPALWATVDVNPQNGKIDCRNQAEIDITRKRIGQQTKGVFIYFSFNGIKASSNNYFFKYDDGWEILPGETPYRFFILADAYPTEFKYSILVHSLPIGSEECIFRYYPTSVDSSIPYTNKLEWGSSSEPQHIHTPLIYTFGFLHGVFSYFENSYIPENSNCSATSSGSSSSSSQSKNNASLDTPRINCVIPIKKLE